MNEIVRKLLNYKKMGKDPKDFLYHVGKPLGGHAGKTVGVAEYDQESESVDMDENGNIVSYHYLAGKRHYFTNEDICLLERAGIREFAVPTPEEKRVFNKRFWLQ